MLDKAGIEAHHVIAFEKGGSWYKKYTLDIACKWLREAHRLFIRVTADYEYVDPDWDSDNDEMRIFYKIEINRFTDKNEVSDETWQKPIEEVEFETYEEAIEAAIRYCLKNLI